MQYELQCFWLNESLCIQLERYSIVLTILSRQNEKPDLHRTNDNQLKIKGPSFSFRLCGPESER